MTTGFAVVEKYASVRIGKLVVVFGEGVWGLHRLGSSTGERLPLDRGRPLR
jgi:hypothetical protein